jgi:phytoene/squalene synthetase
VLSAGDLADAAVSHAAVAIAVAEQLRDLAFLAERRRCRLPLDWLQAAGANAEDVFAGAQRAEIEQVSQRLHGKALAALKALNGSRFPTRAMPALAVATLARWVPGAAMPSWQRVARLAFANLTWRM